MKCEGAVYLYWAMEGERGIECLEMVWVHYDQGFAVTSRRQIVAGEGSRENAKE